MTAATTDREAPLLPRPMRFAILGAWAGLILVVVIRWGIPFERLQVFAWIVATLALVALLSGELPRRLLLVDWLPLGLLLLAYDLTRGAADTLGMPVQFDSIADLESSLFGGNVPTVWLQERLYRHPTWEVSWWEAPIALIYTTHFVVPYVVGAWFWSRGRDRWHFWMRRYVGVTAVGLATYILVPAAPPWLASQKEVIGPVERTTLRGWSVLELDVAQRLLDMGQASVNHVAAMPSLHAAHAVLIPFLFWPGRRLLARVGLVAFPVAMGAALVVTGEHYVVDVLAGVVVVIGVCRAAGWWERRSSAAAAVTPAVPATNPLDTPTRSLASPNLTSSCGTNVTTSEGQDDIELEPSRAGGAATAETPATPATPGQVGHDPGSDGGPQRIGNGEHHRQRPAGPAAERRVRGPG